MLPITPISLQFQSWPHCNQVISESTIFLFSFFLFTIDILIYLNFLILRSFLVRLRYLLFLLCALTRTCSYMCNCLKTLLNKIINIKRKRYFPFPEGLSKTKRPPDINWDRCFIRQQNTSWNLRRPLNANIGNHKKFFNNLIELSE